MRQGHWGSRHRQTVGEREGEREMRRVRQLDNGEWAEGGEGMEREVSGGKLVAATSRAYPPTQPTTHPLSPKTKKTNATESISFFS